MGPLARTGMTAAVIGGASYLDPRALALAPFLSPRLGASYARGLGRAAVGTGQAIGTAGPVLFRTGAQSAPRLFGGQ